MHGERDSREGALPPIHAGRGLPAVGRRGAPRGKSASSAGGGSPSGWWYSPGMPTALQRIQVSVTADLERALEIADRAWPDSARSELLTRLAELGAAALDGRLEQARQARRRVLDDTRGALMDAYPPGYLDELRGDWPA